MHAIAQTPAWLILAAGVVAALGVIWRGVVRPMRQLLKWIEKRTDEWTQTVATVHDLVQLVAELLVDAEHERVQPKARRMRSVPDAAIDQEGPLGEALRRIYRTQLGGTHEVST